MCWLASKVEIIGSLYAFKADHSMISSWRGAVGGRGGGWEDGGRVGGGGAGGGRGGGWGEGEAGGGEGGGWGEGGRVGGRGGGVWRVGGVEAPTNKLTRKNAVCTSQHDTTISSYL